MNSLRLADDLSSVVNHGRFQEAAVGSLSDDSEVMHAEFIARGLSSRDQAREDDEYYSSEEVMSEVESILARARES